jgi:hypothetical protein
VEHIGEENKMTDELKWDIDKMDIDNKDAKKINKKFNEAYTKMKTRTLRFDEYSKIAHNLSLVEDDDQTIFSEGSAQSIIRKIISQTIQRVPDGTIYSPYDKNSWEQVVLEYIFRSKVLLSEFRNKDMHKNLIKTFKQSLIYGFSAVRVGFKNDIDGDVRITYNKIHWNDIYPDPDCGAIEDSEWYIIRDWLSKSDVEALLDDEGDVIDNTYNVDTVRYLIDNKVNIGSEYDSNSTYDKRRGTLRTNSVEIRTFYKRGADEFMTVIPSVNAVLRTVKNYDPRKDVPILFLIPDPDDEFPLGVSQIEQILGKQQYADVLQAAAIKSTLLAMQPPMSVFGTIEPSSISFEPRALWMMGNNPNSRLEPYPINTSMIELSGQTIEQNSAGMMRNLNTVDATVASDAKIPSYPGSNNGQTNAAADKTITVNTYQKRVEYFFSDFADVALKTYINSLSGEQTITVDEETRRKINDIRNKNKSDSPPIDGDKLTIDFTLLKAQQLSFEMRTGSLTNTKREDDLAHIERAMIANTQQMGNAQNYRQEFEQIQLMLYTRFLELMDIDMSQTTADVILDKEAVSQINQAMMQTAHNTAELDKLRQQHQMLEQAVNNGQPTQEANHTQDADNAPQEQEQALPEPQQST